MIDAREFRQFIKKVDVLNLIIWESPVPFSGSMITMDKKASAMQCISTEYGIVGTWSDPLASGQRRVTLARPGIASCARLTRAGGLPRSVRFAALARSDHIVGSRPAAPPLRVAGTIACLRLLSVGDLADFGFGQRGHDHGHAGQQEGRGGEDLELHAGREAEGRGGRGRVTGWLARRTYKGRQLHARWDHPLVGKARARRCVGLTIVGTKAWGGLPLL